MELKNVTPKITFHPSSFLSHFSLSIPPSAVIDEIHFTAPNTVPIWNLLGIVFFLRKYSAMFHRQQSHTTTMGKLVFRFIVLADFPFGSLVRLM